MNHNLEKSSTSSASESIAIVLELILSISFDRIVDATDDPLRWANDEKCFPFFSLFFILFFVEHKSSLWPEKRILNKAISHRLKTTSFQFSI